MNSIKDCEEILLLLAKNRIVALCILKPLQSCLCLSATTAVPRGAAFFFWLVRLYLRPTVTLSLTWLLLKAGDFFSLLKSKVNTFYLMIRCHCELMFGPFVGMILQEHMEGNWLHLVRLIRFLFLPLAEVTVITQHVVLLMTWGFICSYGNITNQC